MAKIKRAGRNFFNLFKGSEILPAEFKNHHELEEYISIQNSDFYINL